MQTTATLCKSSAGLAEAIPQTGKQPAKAVGEPSDEFSALMEETSAQETQEQISEPHETQPRNTAESSEHAPLSEAPEGDETDERQGVAEEDSIGASGDIMPLDSTELLRLADESMPTGQEGPATMGTADASEIEDARIAAAPDSVPLPETHQASETADTEASLQDARKANMNEHPALRTQAEPTEGKAEGKVSAEIASLRDRMPSDLAHEPSQERPVSEEADGKGEAQSAQSDTRSSAEVSSGLGHENANPVGPPEGRVSSVAPPAQEAGHDPAETAKPTGLTPAGENTRHQVRDAASNEREKPIGVFAERAQPAPQAAAERATPATRSPGVREAQLLEDIVKSGRTLTRPNGSSEIRIRLRPPELGGLVLRLTLTNNRLQARIYVDNHAARQMVEGIQQRVRQALADDGIDLERFDVGLRRETGSNPEQHARTREFRQRSETAVSAGPAETETRAGPTMVRGPDAHTLGVVDFLA